MQPRFPRKVWKAEVHKMVDVYGAPISESDQAQIVDYLTATFGFPLPSLPGKDHSQRYTCENHPCGCRSAEDCWRHCC